MREFQKAQEKEGLAEKDGAGTVKSRESGDGKGQMKEHVLKNCIVKHYSD